MGGHGLLRAPVAAELQHVDLEDVLLPDAFSGADFGRLEGESVRRRFPDHPLVQRASARRGGDAERA